MQYASALKPPSIPLPPLPRGPALPLPPLPVHGIPSSTAAPTSVGNGTQTQGLSACATTFQQTLEHNMPILLRASAAPAGHANVVSCEAPETDGLENDQGHALSFRIAQPSEPYGTHSFTASPQVPPVMPTDLEFSGLLCDIDRAAHDIRLCATLEAQHRSLGGKTGVTGSLSMALYEAIVPRARQAAGDLEAALNAYIGCMDERLFAVEQELSIARAPRQDTPARLRAMANVVTAEVRCQQACWTALNALLHYGFLSHHACQAFDEVLTLASPGLRSERVVLAAAKGFQRLLAERRENTLGTAVLMLRSLTSHQYGAVTRDHRLRALRASEAPLGAPHDELQALIGSRNGLAHTMKASQHLQGVIDDLSIERIRPFLVRADACMKKGGTFLPESVVIDQQQARLLAWSASASGTMTGLKGQLDVINSEWCGFLKTFPFEQSLPRFAQRAEEAHYLMRLRRMIALGAFKTALGYFFESCIHRHGWVKFSPRLLSFDEASSASRLIYTVITESMRGQLLTRQLSRQRL